MEIHWGSIVFITLLFICFGWAIAESLARQREMKREFDKKLGEITAMLHALSRRLAEESARITGTLDAFSACPTKDRRANDRRTTDDWLTDSTFRNHDHKTQ